MDNFALRKEQDDREPTPTDTEKFARMLEESSLGSDESRLARLTGSQVLAEHSIVGSPWLHHAPGWPDIAALHEDIAKLFATEGQSEASELWLRAALTRATNGPTATHLAAVLEQRRAKGEAVTWYLRAAERGHSVATARLAVLCCGLEKSREIATLLLSLGRAQMASGRLVQAGKLAKALAKAGRRHRAKLISECDDGDLLFWVGSVLHVSRSRDAAAECYSAAVIKEHAVAAISLLDLTMSAVPDEEVADVRWLTDRLAEAAVNAEPTQNVTHLRTDESKDRSSVGDDLDVLVGAAVGGERHAMDRLLRRIYPLVVRYCRAKVGHQERTSVSADDVAQEVLYAVLNALPNYRDQGRPFLAFVYGIAAHKVADAHRSAGRNRADPMSDVPDSAIQSDGPEQRVLQDALSVEMDRMLRVLPAKQREIVVLRVMVGLSAEETAQAVGSTLGAVRVAQNRALSRLHKVLPRRIV